MHVHHLTGGGNLDFESTGESLAQSNCTNSIVTLDKSAYWAPWMYFQHENGTVVPVNLALGLTAYYKFEKRLNTGGEVEYSVFPKGLKMLSGNTAKRTWTGPWPPPAESFWGPEDTTQDALQEKALGFNCMNYEPGKNEPSFANPYMRSKSFLDANCKQGVRAEIIFPSCWDGKNLDSDDHKSHVAFPSLLQDGTCPKTHPIYLPILFYETIWNTQEFAGVPGQFVFSNGDPTGYGYHADFIAAWDDGIQEEVQQNTQCTSLLSDGQVESCPVFAGHIQTKEEARQCVLNLPESLVDEQTDGFLDRLPGNVKITGVQHLPGEQLAADDDYAPTSSIPESRSSAAATNSAETAPGYYSSAVSVTGSVSTSASAPAFTSPSSTTTPPPSQAASDISSVTTTYTSGKYVVEMVLVETVETVTATTAPVLTQTVVVPDRRKTVSRKDRRKRHIHHHVHNHDHF
ncbi:hypothetical protein LTR64_004807 [Lithohypha guttulata]|uniref:uncharacterized protein n=1 Tax=Lithohypha guttulata TaxID=1690604 RepID=UPI00315C5C66